MAKTSVESFIKAKTESDSSTSKLKFLTDYDKPSDLDSKIRVKARTLSRKGFIIIL